MNKFCRNCGLEFTDAEWDARHDDAQGEDIHEFCCHKCNPVEAKRASKLAAVREAARVTPGTPDDDAIGV